jgi:hypothetical protein
MVLSHDGKGSGLAGVIRILLADDRERYPGRLKRYPEYRK